MTEDGTENLVLAQLRELRSELQVFRNEARADTNHLREDVHEVMKRLTNIERSYAVLQESMDRMRGDVEHVKRRLRLSDIPEPEPSR